MNYVILINYNVTYCCMHKFRTNNNFSHYSYSRRQCFIFGVLGLKIHFRRIYIVDPNPNPKIYIVDPNPNPKIYIVDPNPSPNIYIVDGRLTQTLVVSSKSFLLLLN